MTLRAPHATTAGLRRPRAVWLAVLGLAAGAPGPLAAQSAAAAAGKPPRLTCFRGQPLPACRRFVLTELGFLRNVATTSRPAVGYDGTVYPGLRDEDHASEILVELGMMANRGPNHAIGGALVLGPDVGAKVRYRRWLDTSGLAVDVGAGIVRERRFRSRSAAVVGDVALNFSDYGAIVLRGSASHRDGRLATGLHAGARLGSKPALIGGTAVAIGFALLYAALASAWND
ncbi:MAG: hypothetical protein IT355_07140 [Gemmatimonadaceae bacterium]|nr:hypothetical protein [Gemmatimonadaceae bacterium]